MQLGIGHDLAPVLRVLTAIVFDVAPELGRRLDLAEMRRRQQPREMVRCGLPRQRDIGELLVLERLVLDLATEPKPGAFEPSSLQFAMEL